MKVVISQSHVTVVVAKKSKTKVIFHNLAFLDWAAVVTSEKIFLVGLYQAGF